MLMMVFYGENWVVTPERRDPSSNKKPDLIVEKVTSKTKEVPELYLLMELKAVKGDGLEKALAQTVNPDVLAETLEEMSSQTGKYELYVVVQRGTKIAFFEYHSDIDSMEEEMGIANFRGCISLTQNYKTAGKVLQDKPNDLEPLFEYFPRMKEQLKKPEDQEIRNDAKKYTERCVFDLEKHEKYINFLFHHMANKEPRSWLSARELRARVPIGSEIKPDRTPFPNPRDSSGEEDYMSEN